MYVCVSMESDSITGVIGVGLTSFCQSAMVSTQHHLAIRWLVRNTYLFDPAITYLNIKYSNVFFDLEYGCKKSLVFIVFLCFYMFKGTM